MYEEVIRTITEGMKTSYDGEIYKAIQRVGVFVDKEELLKALKYDRGQYDKGFNDGYELGYANGKQACIQMMEEFIEQTERSDQ